MLYIYLVYSKEFNKFLFEQGSMYDLPKVKEGSKLQGNPFLKTYLNILSDKNIFKIYMIILKIFFQTKYLDREFMVLHRIILNL
jgi:hypothetical protein